MPVAAGQWAWDLDELVLTVAKVTNTGAGGYAEYLDAKSQPSQLGDYYLKDGERAEAPGRWAQGAGLFDLDAEQPVTGEQLRTLMDVRRPDTGQELRRVGGSGDAVAAIDATFSAPKSVSAAWALARPELRDQIERAHETAIDRALHYAVRQVPMLRRRVSPDTVVHEKATGLVATSWRHTTARAVEQQAPDPQLHSHVLLHAAVRRDRRVVAIDSRSWLVHQREVGAAYRTELAHELTRLGFSITRGTGRGRRYFELDAIPQPLIDRWSSRRHQVQAAIQTRLADQQHALEAIIAQGGPGAANADHELQVLQKTGLLSPKQERMTAIQTRTGKTPHTVADLDQEWRRTALALGASRERIDVLRHQTLPALLPAKLDDVLQALTEFDATFAARDARAIALEQSPGTPIPDALQQLRELRADDEILVLADGTGTTRQHRGRERTVVAIVQRLTTTRLKPLPATVTAREADRLDEQLSRSGGRLSDEQRAAIELACGTQALVVIEGHAGTGKSTTLAGIARAHQASGREILATSTAALAAQRLAGDLADQGVECQAYSTAGLHAAVSSGRLQLGPETTVIHDEAALASTTEQLRLLAAVEDAGARLIEVGDSRQNQPVGAGGLWDQIHQAADETAAHVQLTRNQRARDPDDRRDQALFRQGEIHEAIRGYDSRDRIHLDTDQQRAEDRALDAAHADRGAGKTTIVIAQTSNEHLDELNARAQAIRRQHGELGDASVALPGRPYRLHAGDDIQIRHTTRHPEHGPLRNGTTALITEVSQRTGELELRLADGTEMRLNRQQAIAADLRLAYVQHPFPAQGQTIDTTHVIIGDHTTREGSYVALTRARDHTHIYAANITQLSDRERVQQLAERMSHTEPDLPSIHTPLAHETQLTGYHTMQHAKQAQPVQAINGAGLDTGHQHSLAHHDLRNAGADSAESPPGPGRELGNELATDTQSPGRNGADRPDLGPVPERTETTTEPPARTWPRTPDRELGTQEHANALEPDHIRGWEP